MNNKPVKSLFSRKFIHFGVVVRDVDRAIERLESLGIGPFKADPPPPLVGKMLFRGKTYDGEIKVFKARIGDVVLELFEPDGGESPWREFLDTKGEGIHHIAFDSDNFDKDVAGFTEQGVSVLHSARSKDGGGSVYLDLGVGDLIIELEKAPENKGADLKDEPQKAPFPNKLIHVGVVVRDMGKAIERLSSFGMGPFAAPELPPMTGYFWDKPSTSKQKVLGAKMGNVEIELFEPVKGNSPWQEFLDSKGEGIHHIAFDSDDIDGDTARFTEQGAGLMHSAKWEGGGGVYLDLGVGDIIIELFELYAPHYSWDVR